MSDLLVEISHYEVEINGGHKLFSYEVISLSKPLRFMRILSLGYMLLVKLLGQILSKPFCFQNQGCSRGKFFLYHILRMILFSFHLKDLGILNIQGLLKGYG